MKDLKHIRTYERLLEQANNELVQQAERDGCVSRTPVRWTSVNIT